MNRLLTLAVVAVTVTGCKPAPLQTPGEFVCETSGELTERHVGVADAWLRDTRGPALWVIKYADGDGASRYYLQKPGETCAVERAR
jgi:hypothetical protein